MKNKEMENDKLYIYGAIITQKISELFDEDSDSELRIDFKDLEDSENLGKFFHALSTLMPNYYFNKFTGEDKSVLEFNHIANGLCFEHGVSEK